jgi:hypothetical protein
LGKRVGFLVQGTTFLKSIFPLVIFSGRVDSSVDCFLYMYESRPAKLYDNLDINYVLSLIDRYCGDNVTPVIVSDDKEVMSDMRSKGIKNLVCQDAQHHSIPFCVDDDITVFSIGVFFDSLHYANRVRSKVVRTPKIPNFKYFPNSEFMGEFIRMVPTGAFGGCNMRAIGSPLFDHSLFIDKKPPHPNGSVCFLTTVQNMVSKDVQKELEKFALHCINSDIKFTMKTKQKTPWTFIDGGISSKVCVVEKELGFPYTSLGLILNSDLHISSYSTSVCESSYFGKPCINLESVGRKSLIYAIESIKYDYEMGELFDSLTCKTVVADIGSIFDELISTQSPPERSLSLDDNNSIDIMTDIFNNIL